MNPFPREGMDALLRALLLIRVGQLLGSDSSLARAIHDLIEAIIGLAQQ